MLLLMAKRFNIVKFHEVDHSANDARILLQYKNKFSKKSYL